ncbi:MAG: YhcH/YjgK/YiaL family protein [Oscillospiraceae bacterium]|jgi:YhcH/YjgK/YiaL family protein|nr:YhcH/YjgK/YiaL family protein [Oscillospiraceae bacterium]
MIFDKLNNLKAYAAMLPDWAVIEEYLQKIASGELTEKKYEIDGKRLHLSVQEYEPYAREGRYLEAHRKYIDLQFAVSGSELIGWAPTDELTVRTEEFSKGGDIAFYEEEPKLWIPLEEGTFTLLYPQDAHMPCIRMGGAGGSVKKVVVKIAV